MRITRIAALLPGVALAACLALPQPAAAQDEGEAEAEIGEIEDEPRPEEAEPDTAEEPEEEAALEPTIDVGGALRFNYFVKSWEGEEANRDRGGDFALDTIRLNFDGTYGPLLLSAEYRFYAGYSMLHHGFMGLKLGENTQVDAGVSQVPFGILPYASHNWFFTLAYYLGLEDDYDLGVRYLTKFGDLDVQAAFYKNSEGSYTGSSVASARYSYDVVPTTVDELGYAGLTEGRSNVETNGGALRLAYTLEHGEDLSTEIGVSGRGGQLYNGETAEFGSRWAAAAHVNGNYGPVNVMAEAIRYEFSPANPDGVRDDFVVMGAYDAPYKVASKGTILLGGVSYLVPVNLGPLDSLTFYDDFSVLLKDEEGFADSYENVVGFVVSAGPIWSYVDFAMGKNHPWLGPNYGSALAEGGTTNDPGDPASAESDWESRFNINLAWYF